MGYKSDSAEVAAVREGGHARTLRLVEAPPYYTEEVCLWTGNPEEGAHSLHQVMGYPGTFRPELAAYFIKRYSKRGDTVLDPFCGAGTTGLEANMNGRVAIQSDINPLGLLVARGKLEPADLAEVTLSLQGLSLKRPVDCGPFREIFCAFYDAETFREIVNLRALLANREDRISVFLKLVALSLLHGPSAGYFSVYSSPVVSPTPDEQHEMNRKRRQTPDFRAVLPRLLRKTASVLRDGIPLVMRQVTCQNKVLCSDARNLAAVPNSSVDLVVSGPPLPDGRDELRDQWLRSWFLGIPGHETAERTWKGESIPEWCDFMNEVLFELARVVKSGGRAVFALSDVKQDRAVIALDEEFIGMVHEHLPRCWTVECVTVHHEKSPTIHGSVRSRRSTDPAANVKAVVLRRR